MRLITRYTLAQTVPERWARVYGRETAIMFQKEVEIIAVLNALPRPIDPDEVDRIIGNTSWSEVPICDECRTPGLSAVMEMGEEPDYDSSTACLCLDCLRKAVIELEDA